MIRSSRLSPRVIPHLVYGGIELMPPTPGKQQWLDTAGKLAAYGGKQEGVKWIHSVGIGTFYFDGGSEVTVYAHQSVTSELIEDAYYRSILPFILPEIWNIEVLHASAVQSPGGLLGFCAASETGKSTISYALHQRGYPLWADDALTLDIQPDGITSIPLPSRTRLRPAPARLFQQPQPLTWLSAERQPSPIAALFVMEQVSDGPLVQCERFTPSEAFVALLPHAYSFDMEDKARKQLMVQQYLRIATDLDVYHLRFRTGLENLPAVLACIEQHIR